MLPAGRWSSQRYAFTHRIPDTPVGPTETVTAFLKFLPALLLIALGQGCSSTPPLRPSQIQVLRQLGECLRTVKAHANSIDHYDSICLTQPPHWDDLIGVSRAEVVNYAGAGGGSKEEAYIYPLSSPSHALNVLGRSDLLRLHFDAGDRVSSIDFLVIL
jgi:hypothetical protein